jgi:phosphate transport system substrate-binding protein
MTRRRRLLPLLASIALFALGCSPSNSVPIQGCGATFPAPLYKRWFLEYYRQNPEVRVNYVAIGSGAGVSQFEEGLVDFAATDEALKKDKLDALAAKLSEREHRDVELLQFPMTAGSIAICYNLPGKPALNLTREAYLDMLLGKIKFWDDEKIQASNEVTLPHMRIHFIQRAEGSGTTFVFTNHLSAVDERWKNGKGLGANKSIEWPVGIGAKGNSGVAALIDQTPGAFGYIETGYAELVELPIAALENKQGQFVLPTQTTCAAALAEAVGKFGKEQGQRACIITGGAALAFGSKFDKVLGVAIPDPSWDRYAYPIVSFTWIVCRKHYSKPRLAASMKGCFEYCLESGTPDRGQELSAQLGYIPMPPKVLDLSRAAVAQIQSD